MPEIVLLVHLLLREPVAVLPRYAAPLLVLYWGA